MAQQPTYAAPVPPKVRPSAWWYLLVAGLWLLAIAMFVSIGITFVRVIDDGVTPVPPSGTIVLPSEGLTVYSSQQPTNTSCFLVSPREGTTPLDALGFDLTATFQGQRIHALATTPSGLSSGSYRLSCPGLGPAATLWTGDRLPMGSVLLRAVVAGLCGVLGLVLLVLLLVRRHLSRSRISSSRLAYAPGQPTGWGAPAWPSPHPGPADRYGPPGGPEYGQHQPPQAPHGQMGPPSYGHQPTPTEQQPPYDEETPAERGDQH